jgi:hypothetical protein
MSERPRRVTIGFEGGQVLAVRCAGEQIDELRGKLAGGGWYELTAEDGVVTLDLSDVVYVRTETDEQRVGFGS